jgi:transposase
MIGHRLPRRKIARQVTPKAAGTQQIKESVEDGAEAVATESPTRCPGRQKALEARPLGIREIAWIGMVHATDCSSWRQLSVLHNRLFVVRTGCAWRYLPADIPPWQAVFYHFRRFCLKGTWHRLYTTLHRAERERVGHHPDPGDAIMDSQSVKTVEESGASADTTRTNA